MSTQTLGHIDQLDGRDIVGWLYSPAETVVPQLYVNGRPCTLLDWPTSRPDVAEALGTPANVGVNVGFRFAVPALPAESQISLFAVSTERVDLVQSRTLPQTLCETNPLLQLRQVKAVADQKGAVAVTCWEGSHNPIGRAKVLYDILATKRPAVIFTYLFDEFGSALWLPAAQANIQVVCIPWAEREVYHQLMKRMGIRFDTVWICKSRVPSFLLASIIGNQKTKYILDLDDNESAFVRNEVNKETAYGALSESLARFSMDSISARTVASASLQREFGGKIVRHARIPSCTDRTSTTSKYKQIAFIGTARAHKGILAAAQAIQSFNASSEYRVTLHVYGDIPSNLKQQLNFLNVEVKGHICPDDLFPTLSTMDAVLTGFPLEDSDVQNINTYQISSKISDALAVGLPVLVPESPAVADLCRLTGVYIFTQKTFTAQCQNALSNQTPVALPLEFTLDGAYQTFLKVEQQAEPGAILPFKASIVESEAPRPTLILLWKQHDAGLYGRRVDQIARSYRMQHPDHHVIILELISEGQRKTYSALQHSFCSDASLILQAIPTKESADYTTPDGVQHLLLSYTSDQDLQQHFLRRMVNMRWSPEQTVFVLFPLVGSIACLNKFLEPFPLIVDFVDNQLFWATDERRALAAMSQYAVLARVANHCVFNSEDNLNTFRDYGVLSESVPVTLIPNWYRQPFGIKPSTAISPRDDLHVFYSGNMNDRVDWDTLTSISKLLDVTLHLVGTAQRAQSNLQELLRQQNVVYHGPRTELQTLSLLQAMDVAIIPHCQNNCSQFMNPIKVGMYTSVGIPILSMRVSGIAAHHNIQLCADGTEMVSLLSKWQPHCWQAHNVAPKIYFASSEQLYMDIIGSLQTVNAE